MHLNCPSPYFSCEYRQFTFRSTQIKHPGLKFVLFLCLSLALSFNAKGQSACSLQDQQIVQLDEQSYLPSQLLELGLERFFAQDNDSVLVITEVALSNMDTTLLCPLYLRLKLLDVETRERAQDYADVLEELIFLSSDAVLEVSPKVTAGAHLILALIREKTQDGTNCRKSLDAANQIIEEHDLDSLAAFHAIRFASYHRFYGSMDSLEFYANRALSIAKEGDYINPLTQAHLLLGFVNFHRQPEIAREHFRAMGKGYLKMGDYLGYSSHFSNLSSTYVKFDEWEKALSLNDSSLFYLDVAFENGLDDPMHLAIRYKNRAEIFKGLGMADSVQHYLQASFQEELKYYRKDNEVRMAEIEARYLNEQQDRLLAEQEVQLTKVQSSRFWMAVFIVVILLFGSILLYFLLQLRMAYRKLRFQAGEISNANQQLSQSLHQQLVLKGEIHHRVKNNLQVIISLLDLQKEDLKDPKARASLESMASRIYSMAAIHEILYQEDNTEMVSLLHYVQKLCDHFHAAYAGEVPPLFQLKVPDWRLNLETLMPLGILLNELITNSLKYASRPGEPLKIMLDIQPVSSGYKLRYQDNGPGLPGGKLPDQEGSLGAYLVRSMVRQLQGSLVCSNERGATFDIEFQVKTSSSSFPSIG